MASANGSPRARALAAALRRAREESGLSLRALSNRLKLDQSYLSRVENGKRVPSIETAARILGTLQTSPDECERVLGLARNAAEPNWLTVGVPGTPQQLAGAVECERAATAITTWHPCLIPGLLQTTDYARAIAVANGRLNRQPEHQVEARVMVKMARREVLTRRDPVQFKAMIWEPVLRLPIAEPAVMSEQLHYLVTLSEQPNITIRVVPHRVAWHPGSAGPFVFYEFADASPVIYFEHHSSGAFDQDADDVDEYRTAIAEITRLALSADDSTTLIKNIIDAEWTSS